MIAYEPDLARGRALLDAHFSPIATHLSQLTAIDRQDPKRRSWLQQIGPHARKPDDGRDYWQALTYLERTHQGSTPLFANSDEKALLFLGRSVLDLSQRAGSDVHMHELVKGNSGEHPIFVALLDRFFRDNVIAQSGDPAVEAAIRAEATESAWHKLLHDDGEAMTEFASVYEQGLGMVERKNIPTTEHRVFVTLYHDLAYSLQQAKIAAGYAADAELPDKEMHEIATEARGWVLQKWSGIIQEVGALKQKHLEIQRSLSPHATRAERLEASQEEQGVESLLHDKMDAIIRSHLPKEPGARNAEPTNIPLPLSAHFDALVERFDARYARAEGLGYAHGQPQWYAGRRDWRDAQYTKQAHFDAAYNKICDRMQGGLYHLTLSGQNDAPDLTYAHSAFLHNDLAYVEGGICGLAGQLPQGTDAQSTAHRLLGQEARHFAGHMLVWRSTIFPPYFDRTVDAIGEESDLSHETRARVMHALAERAAEEKERADGTPCMPRIMTPHKMLSVYLAADACAEPTWSNPLIDLPPKGDGQCLPALIVEQLPQAERDATDMLAAAPELGPRLAQSTQLARRARAKQASLAK